MNLSPTTEAATSGLRLSELLNANGPNDRRHAAAVPAAAAGGGNALGGGRDDIPEDDAFGVGIGNGSSRTSRGLAGHQVQPRSRGGGGVAVATEKENERPSNSEAGFSHRSQGETTKGSSQGPRARGLVRNGARSSSESDSSDSLEGLRLCYFDENNVMDGAVVNGNLFQSNGFDDDQDFSEEDFLPNQHPNANSVVNTSQYANQPDDDDNMSDDEASEASGDTVVHDDRPPPPQNATREELNRYYWEICYGPLDEKVVESQMKSASAVNASLLRSAPAKSCLSTKKKRGIANKPAIESMTPRRILHNSPDNNVQKLEGTNPSTPIEDGEDTTPKNNVTRLAPLRAKTQSAVKFGNNSAAEFDFLKPITEMTPIPSSEVQKIFPSEVKETEKEVEEHEVSRETARNVATLAEWDDDFDDIIGDDDEGGNGSRLPRKKRGRKRGGTPYKLTGGRRRSSGLSRPRKSRRESSLFSRERRSLIDPDDSMEMEESGVNNDGNGGPRDRGGNLLPFSVTIDPEEYTSPSSMSVSTLGTPAALTGKGDVNEENNYVLNTTADDVLKQTRSAMAHRDSLDSACISPSSSLRSSECNAFATSDALDTSIDSDVGMGGALDTSVDSVATDASAGIGRESSDSNATGKATPNSARTSSSTILRAVHASGALSPGNSPPQGAASAGGNGGGGNGVLMPNQLKYSPSSSSSGGSSSMSTSTVRMDASPSDSGSLGSDIMSLFTNHSLGDDADEDSNHISMSDKLAMLGNHPTQTFHTSIGDMVTWKGSSTQRDMAPLAFMNEHLLRGLSPSTSLALIAQATTNVEGCRGSDSTESIFCGIQTSQSNEKKGTKSSSFVQRSLESMLLDEIEKMRRSSGSSSNEWSTITADADLHTIASCIRHFHDIACMDWSKAEEDAAKRSLSKLQVRAKVEREKMECNELNDMLGKSNAAVTAAATAHNRKDSLLWKKRKVQSQMENEMCQIKSLEDQLASEVNRLDRAKRAKRLFDTHLELERSSPISVLHTEIHSSAGLTPSVTNNDFYYGTYSLLDGAAEIVTKIAPDHDEEEDDSTVTTNKSAVELGCFIKDGGPAVKLLQFILLGSADMNPNHSHVATPLRRSITQLILEDGGSRDETYHLMAHLFSRIDSLVRSVRELETSGICKVGATADGDANLSVSMHHEGAVVQITFLFRDLLRSDDWRVTTLPDDVKVCIVAPEERGGGSSLLVDELQGKAKSTLFGGSRSSADPILLRRVCEESMKRFVQVVTQVV